MSLTPTPARTAGIPGGDIDRRDRRLNQLGAIGIVLGAYLLITASPILGAVYTGLNNLVQQPVDYSSINALRGLASRLGQIGGTVLILVLLCRWLGVHRDLAGFPRHKEVSPTPAIATAAICILGTLIATVVFDALTPDTANTNSNGGGSVPNGWGWLRIIEAAHTSIVEEIIVVAIPVLIGRRAGWHPIVVVAICAFLRWPYHAYHGTFTSLPWTMIWGGAYVVAYLYLRRLTPIIVVHFLEDLRIMLADVTAWADEITYALTAVLALWIVIWLLTDRRRRVRATNEPTLTGDKRSGRFLLSHNRTGIITGGILAALILLPVILLIIAGVILEPTELLPDLLLAAAIAGAGVVVFGVVWQLFRESNVYVCPPGSGEPITGAVRWHPTYLGEYVIDETRGNIDTVTAITHIAASNSDAVVNFLPPRAEEHRWRSLGFRTRGKPFNTRRRIHIRFDPVTGAFISAEPPGAPAVVTGVVPGPPAEIH